MIWSYVLVAAVGMVFGFVLELGYAHIRGRRIIVPFIPSSSRNFTIGGIAFGIVALVTVIQVNVSDAREAQCNREQRAALAYNTGVTAEQRALNDKAAQISAARYDALQDERAQLDANRKPYPDPECGR